MTATEVDSSDHGFELKKRPTWIWIAESLVLVVAVLVAGRFLFFGKAQSANEIPGRR